MYIFFSTQRQSVRIWSERISDTWKKKKRSEFSRCIFLHNLGIIFRGKEALHIVGGLIKPLISKKSNVQESEKNMAAKALYAIGLPSL